MTKRRMKMATPRIQLITDPALVAKVIKARRALCVGEEFRVEDPNGKHS